MQVLSVWFVIYTDCSSRGCLVEIDTSLASSWSLKLISVGFVVIRGQIDELEQVLVCASSGASRFLRPETFVNSSTVPYCIAMERQKQNEMVYAQNLINSGNDGRRGTTTSTMVNKRQRLQSMKITNRQSKTTSNHQKQ